MEKVEMSKELLDMFIDRTNEVIAYNLKKTSINSMFNIHDTFKKGYSGIYRCGTEDMATYYKYLGTPKSALTIGGSGDQLFNLVDIGATDIHVFDINALTLMGTALRVGALDSLNEREFIVFFQTLAHNLYARSEQNLYEDIAYDWSSMFSKWNNREINEGLFPYVTLTREEFKKINLYLKKERYYALREKMKNINMGFIGCDVYDLPNVIKDYKYDAMIFSNIYEYIDMDNIDKESFLKKAKQYHDFITKDMPAHLNSNGTIMAAYMYAWNDEVRRYVEEMYRNHPEDVVPHGVMTDLEVYKKYLEGFTAQNVSYAMLYNEFMDDDKAIWIPTQHIIFGQSFDTSNDMALIYKP